MLLQTNLNYTTVYTDNEAENRLKEINIKNQHLQDACLAGLLQKNNCNENNTKGGPGFIQWDETIRSLRELSIEDGWTRYQQNHLEGIISENSKTIILPSSGNLSTGNPNQTPINKNPKGYRTIQIIEKVAQGNLFTGYPDQSDDVYNELFILLYYCTDQKLKMELSKPLQITRQGKIVAWQERIIIPEYNLYDFDPSKYNNSPNLPDSDSLDIEVLRR